MLRWKRDKIIVIAIIVIFAHNTSECRSSRRRSIGLSDDCGFFPARVAHFTRGGVMLSMGSHTRTVVRECYKDDCESLWKSLKFDPSPRKNGSTDRPPNLHRWLRSGYLPSAKFCADPTRGFFSPYAWNITPKCSFFLVLQRGYSRGPKTDLHAKYVKRRGPTQGCAFWGFWK